MTDATRCMTTREKVTRAICGQLLALGLAAPVCAQIPGTTFEDLRTSQRLKPGEKIEVTEENGTKYKARFAGLSDKTLEIDRSGAPRHLTEAEVREIRHRRPESRWNGMLIGMAAGAGAGLLLGLNVCDTVYPECEVAVAGLAALGAGCGTGIGALVDAAIVKHDTVFTRPDRVSANTVRVSPLLNKSRAGATVTLQF